MTTTTICLVNCITLNSLSREIEKIIIHVCLCVCVCDGSRTAATLTARPSIGSTAAAAAVTVELQFDAERARALSAPLFLSLFCFNQFGAAKHGVLIRWYVGFSLLFRFTILCSALLGTIFSRKKKGSDGLARSRCTEEEKQGAQTEQGTAIGKVDKYAPSPRASTKPLKFPRFCHRATPPSVRSSSLPYYYYYVDCRLDDDARNSACINESYCC